MNTKTLPAVLAAGGVMLALAGCTQADTVSQNLSNQADNFQVVRAVVLHDDFTNQPVEEIEGRCSLGNTDKGSERSVTCEIGKGKFVKEIFDMGDNESLTSVQINPLTADPYAYKVIFKPTTIDFDLQTPTHNAGGN